MEVPLYFNILWGCRIKDAGDILYSHFRWLKSGGLGAHKRSKTRAEPEELQNVQMELRAETEKMQLHSATFSLYYNFVVR